MLLQRRIDIEGRMIKCGEAIEKAHNTARDEFEVALKGRISQLQEDAAKATTRPPVV